MSSKILESDEVDSKYFRQAFGRLMTLQMENQQILLGIVRFLQERFYEAPDDSSRERTFEEDEFLEQDEDRE